MEPNFRGKDLVLAFKIKNMLTKDLVITSLQDLPEEFELDELIERLIFLQKIKTGMEQAAEGKVKSHEEVKKMVESWRRSRGRSSQ